MGLISEERRNVLEMGVWTRTARHVIDEIEMIRQRYSYSQLRQ